jgi:hypothetical protein
LSNESSDRQTGQLQSYMTAKSKFVTSGLGLGSVFKNSDTGSGTGFGFENSPKIRVLDSKPGLGSFASLLWNIQSLHGKYYLNLLPLLPNIKKEYLRNSWRIDLYLIDTLFSKERNQIGIGIPK